MDDDPAVRSATAEALVQLGYMVHVADSGFQALEVYWANSRSIHVVLLDLTMPVMSGEETLKHLRAINDNVRVILFTGYAENEARLRCEQSRLAGFLTKPFGCDELASVIRLAFTKSEASADHQ